MAVSDSPPGRLIVVVDLDYAGSAERWTTLLRAPARGAVGHSAAIQVRAHGLEPNALSILARRARDEVPRSVPLLLNGPPELAAELEYDGVHLPEGRIGELRASLPLRWVTAAVHSLDAIERAEHAGVDAMLFGSVFEPGSHPGSAAGLDALRAATEATTRPVIAIGGIQPERVADCVEAGAAGVAAISGVVGAADPGEAIARYCEALDSALVGAQGAQRGQENHR